NGSVKTCMLWLTMRKDGRRSPLFFFSSRRRHTRSKRDWSSDVCSSDLVAVTAVAVFCVKGEIDSVLFAVFDLVFTGLHGPQICRSEERRVGKEWRRWWGADAEKKTQGRAGESAESEGNAVQRGGRATTE